MCSGPSAAGDVVELAAAARNRAAGICASPSSDSADRLSTFLSVTREADSETPPSVRQPVDQIVHAELVSLVGLIERPQAAAGPLPELGDVGVVVDDRHQPLRRVVVLVDAPEDRIAADVGLGKVR